MHIQIISRRYIIAISTYLDIHWLQISDQGRFWFDFCPVSLKFAHVIQFQNQMIISRKNLPLHVLIFKSCWVCPGISAFFPGISAFFPQISAQKNRHIFTQRRVRAAQEVGKCRKHKIDQNWPQESKNDHFHVLHKKSALRAEILQTDNYLCVFEDTIMSIAIQIPSDKLT